MYKNSLFSFVAIIATLCVIGLPFKESSIQNYIQTHKNPGYLTPKKSIAADKKPSNLWCYCVDGTVFSYGNSCTIGWVGCEKNDCPLRPQGCNGL